MKPFVLKNNALFLACWHERARPLHMICFGSMIFGAILLTYLSISLGGGTRAEIWKGTFYALIFTQAIVLLVLGSLFAWHMGSREKTSGTLDFHRNSPEDVQAKTIGLILGSTWFEWAVFALLFVCELPFAWHRDISLSSIILCNVSMAVAGIFFHTACVVFALLTTKKERGVSPLIVLFLLLWIGPYFVFVLGQSSISMYLFGVSSFVYFFPEAIDMPGYFLIWKFPPIILQAFIQIPLVVLLLNCLKRIFRLPNSPAWSKKDIILFCGFLLALTAGFFVANCLHPIDNRYGYSFNSRDSQIAGFLGLFVVSGILISLSLVPSYFDFFRRIVLGQKQKPLGLNPFLEGSSGLTAIMLYVGLAASLFTVYVFMQEIPSRMGIACFLLMSSYVIAFSGFLEYFRLSRFRKQKVFFMTGLILWWVFCPWLLGVASNFRPDSLYMTLTPPLGLAWSMSLISGERSDLTMVSALGPSLVVAALMWILAWREGQMLAERIRQGLKTKDRSASA